MFKLIVIANDLPKFNNPDKATFNRTRVIPFESTFCHPDRDPAPETYEEQLRTKRFPMDKDYTDKIPGLLPAFAWYLLEHRKKPKSNVIPEKVIAATAVFKKQNDINRQFIEENIIDVKNTKISMNELYIQFKEWYKEGFPGQSLPVKNEIKDYFIKLWGNFDYGQTWKGHRLRTLKDDIAEGKCVILEDSDLASYEKSDSPI